ncbi:hypothetical protein DFQ26_009575 [Actinomortierella ambigua]|nr:hypothetical protein DFQ26_009575 [Actinomortierella ambigua]
MPAVAEHSPFRCYGGLDPKARSFETIPSAAPTTRVDRPRYYSSRTKGLAFSIVQYAWKTVQRCWSTTSSALASASAATAVVRSDEQTRTRGRERCYDKSRSIFPIEHHEDDIDGERKQLSASVNERAPGEAGNNSIDDRDDQEEGEGQEARGSAGKGVDGKPTMLLPHLETLKVYHTSSSSNSSTTSLQDRKKAYERYSKNEERKRANIVAYVGQLRSQLTFELMAGRFDDRPRKLAFHGDF